MGHSNGNPTAKINQKNPVIGTFYCLSYNSAVHKSKENGEAKVQNERNLRKKKKKPQGQGHERSLPYFRGSGEVKVGLPVDAK